MTARTRVLGREVGPWWLWVLAAWIWASCAVMAMRIWVG